MNTITKSCRDEIDLNQMGLGLNQIVVLTEAGSSMYGTQTPTSDRDYLGIYVPTERQLLINNYPKQVSLPKDSGLDLQIWSIHYFLKLAMQGETMAIDLTHAPEHCIVAREPEVWGFIQDNRTKFYTKGMKSFVSYARKQAAKYGIKGTRIEALENVIAYLKGCLDHNPFYHDDGRLKDIWENLPKGEHIHFLDTEPYKMYQVAGKKFQETVKITYILERLEKDLTSYGKRAMLARENKGIDWKGVSHAIRSAQQVHDILTLGDYQYPLRNAEFITKVKMGKLDFESVVQPLLEEDMRQVETLIEKSNLPEPYDQEWVENQKFWNDWVVKLMRDKVLWQI